MTRPSARICFNIVDVADMESCSTAATSPTQSSAADSAMSASMRDPLDSAPQILAERDAPDELSADDYRKRQDELARVR